MCVGPFPSFPAVAHLIATKKKTFELWFKQVLYELKSVVSMFTQPSIHGSEVYIGPDGCGAV